MNQDLKYITTLRSGSPKEVDRTIKFLFDRYEERIIALVKSNSGNEHDGMEIFQQSLVILYERVTNDRAFSLSSSIYTFLYAVARNLWLSELRYRRKNVPLTNAPLEPLIHDHLNIERLEKIQKEIKQSEAFMNAFKKLPEGCQKLLEAYFEDKNSEETAQDMGLTYGSYRVKKTRCINRLKELIKKDER